MLLQFLINGISAGSVYAIVAIGLGIIYNTTGILHFAHGAVYMVSAFVFYYCMAVLHVGLVGSVFVALIFSAGLGVALEFVIYTPLRRKTASSAAYIISSLGAYILLQNAVALIAGNETRVLTAEIARTFHVGSVYISIFQVVHVISFILVISGLWLVAGKTRFGKVIRAVSDNAYLAEVVGIDVPRIRIFVFMAGSVLAGVGAILVALDTGIDPAMGMPMILVCAVAVIVGGVKMFYGAALGGLLLGVAQNLIAIKVSASWQDLVVYGVLVTFLLFRPQGLLGKTRRLEEMS